MKKPTHPKKPNSLKGDVPNMPDEYINKTGTSAMLSEISKSWLKSPSGEVTLADIMKGLRVGVLNEFGCSNVVFEKKYCSLNGTFDVEVKYNTTKLCEPNLKYVDQKHHFDQYREVKAKYEADLKQFKIDQRDYNEWYIRTQTERQIAKSKELLQRSGYLVLEL
jgi:hypothetical protein